MSSACRSAITGRIQGHGPPALWPAGRTSAVGLRLVASSCRIAGDLAGARRHLEACRDAEGRDPSCSPSPRISAPIQAAPRQAVALPAGFVVDLPRSFSGHGGGWLPDRELFLDYRHLTSEGMAVRLRRLPRPRNAGDAMKHFGPAPQD